MDGAEVRCPSCSDYSIVEGMQIRPLENPAEPEGLRFTSPLYKDSRWPRGCVACGAQPDRLEEVSGETVQASSLLVGRLVVAKGKSSRRSVLQCPQRRPRSPLDSGPGAGAPLVLSKDDAPLPCRQSRMRHSVLGSWGSTRLGAPCRSRDGGRVGRGLDQYLDRQRAPSSHKLARELAVIRRDVCIRCGT